MPIMIWPIACSLLQAVVCKYHSVFLTAGGRVLTCGHGRGGRLGHGTEQSVVVRGGGGIHVDGRAVLVEEILYYYRLFSACSPTIYAFWRFAYVHCTVVNVLVSLQQLCEVKALSNCHCVVIAAARDHTVILTKTYVCPLLVTVHVFVYMCITVKTFRLHFSITVLRICMKSSAIEPNSA